METGINVWQREEVVDALDRVLQNGTDFDLVLAQIPAMFGDSPKATYLGFRAIGLTQSQALEVIGVNWVEFIQWKKETPELVDFESRCLTDLQSRIGADIVRLGFLRNMTMFMLRDQITIRKSLTDMEAMTNREFNYLRAVRRHYSNQDLLALEKAIAPEKHRDNTLVLSFGEAKFEVLESESGMDQIKLIEGGQ